MKNLGRKHYYILAAWFIINFIQAFFTGLHSDESYYWMYSENMAWGYFDHPPMVALLIFLGHALIPGELGVRLLFILISTATLGLIFNELNEKKHLFFLTIFVFSFPLTHTHIGGFLALPDTPLLFFTVVFLILYKRFLQEPGFKISVWLAIVAAAMIYSKYHAFLVIGLTVLSNLKLLRSKYFWTTLLLTLLMLAPHLWWQAENEFPTFRYHLFERSKPFGLEYVFSNLISQVVIAGPLTGVIVLWKLRRFRIKNAFDRALIFNILGFYILFFLMSFKNRIEAHWTAAIIPMLMLATYPLISGDLKAARWFRRLSVPVIALFFLARIYLALDIIPNAGHIKIAFYNAKAHAMEIKARSGGKKVAFFNNYATISSYIFYTGDSAVHLSTPGYRFCQYDLWNDERYARGEPLFAVQPENIHPPNLTQTATGRMKGFVAIDKFQSLKGLEIARVHSETAGENALFEVVLSNTSDRAVKTAHISKPSLGIMQERRKEICAVPLTRSNRKNEILPGEKATLRLEVPLCDLNEKLPLLIYTRSKDNYRGEIVKTAIEDLFQGT